MSGILSVRWTVTPITPPEPILFCTGCGSAKPFRSSDKFRLNANGKQIDAWLIYNCKTCGNTWNLPIYERTAVRSMDAATLASLQSNDPHLAEAVAFDVYRLRRHVHTLNEAATVEVSKQVLSNDACSWGLLDIVFRVPLATSVRTDRLLARELKVSRAQLQRLVSVEQSGRRFLRRPIRDEMRVSLDLEASSDRSSIALAAMQASNRTSDPPD